MSRSRSNASWARSATSQSSKAKTSGQGDRLMVLEACGAGDPLPGFPGDGILETLGTKEGSLAGQWFPNKPGKQKVKLSDYY